MKKNKPKAWELKLWQSEEWLNGGYPLPYVEGGSFTQEQNRAIYYLNEWFKLQLEHLPASINREISLVEFTKIMLNEYYALRVQRAFIGMWPGIFKGTEECPAQAKRKAATL